MRLNEPYGDVLVVEDPNTWGSRQRAKGQHSGLGKTRGGAFQLSGSPVLTQRMEQLLPLPLIEAPASAKLNVLLPCTPRAATDEASIQAAPGCQGPCEGKEHQVLKDEPHPKVQEGEAPRKRIRAVAPEANGLCAHRFEGTIRGKLLLETPPASRCTPSSPTVSLGQQRRADTSALDTGLAVRLEEDAACLGPEAEGLHRETGALPRLELSGPEANPIEDSSWEELRSAPFDSLKRAVFQCLQDLRAEVTALADEGSRCPGRFSTHVLNVLDAKDFEDLKPYVELFALCLMQGCLPRCLSIETRQLMLEALAALKATGYSVHVRHVFAEYTRVLRTLKRSDILLAPVYSNNSDSRSNGDRSRARGALLHLAAAAGPEDAELADLWINASLEDPERGDVQRVGGPAYAKACQSRGRPQEYLLRCKCIVVKQLRGLRLLAPVWAARDRAYQYHLDAVLASQTPGELVKYLLILSSLQHDPDGKHPVSIASLLECIRELHVLQRTDPQECATAALPVTQAELAQSLAALHSKRSSDGGGAAGVGPAGRKHGMRSISAMPSLATRGQKHRLMPPQLEAEVVVNLQRLSSLRLPNPFTSSSAVGDEAGARGVDASVMYAEELMAVAAEGNAEPTVAHQAAYAELQRLTQYWAEGMFPSPSEEEAPPPPPPPRSPPQSLYSAPGKQPNTWKLSRTRSTPCPTSAADAPEVAAASGSYSLSAFLNGGTDALCRTSPQRLSPLRSCKPANGPRGVFC